MDSAREQSGALGVVDGGGGRQGLGTGASSRHGDGGLRGGHAEAHGVLMGEERKSRELLSIARESWQGIAASSWRSGRVGGEDEGRVYGVEEEVEVEGGVSRASGRDGEQETAAGGEAAILINRLDKRMVLTRRGVGMVASGSVGGVECNAPRRPELL